MPELLVFSEQEMVEGKILATSPDPLIHQKVRDMLLRGFWEVQEGITSEQMNVIRIRPATTQIQRFETCRSAFQRATKRVLANIILFGVVLLLTILFKSEALGVGVVFLLGFLLLFTGSEWTDTRREWREMQRANS